MIFTNNNPIIIGIDHGYGNIKTAHCCFKTGVLILISPLFGITQILNKGIFAITIILKKYVISKIKILVLCRYQIGLFLLPKEVFQ